MSTLRAAKIEIVLMGFFNFYFYFILFFKKDICTLQVI